MYILVADQCSFSHKHMYIEAYCSCSSTLHATYIIHTTCTNKTIPDSPFSHSWSNNIIIMPGILIMPKVSFLLDVFTYYSPRYEARDMAVSIDRSWLSNYHSTVIRRIFANFATYGENFTLTSTIKS